MTNRAHHPTEESLLDRMAERPTPELVSAGSSEDDTQPAAPVVSAPEALEVAPSAQRTAAAPSSPEPALADDRVEEPGFEAKIFGHENNLIHGRSFGAK